MNRAESDGLTHVDSEQFADLARISKDARILDVRTREEFEDGHIAGAELYDVTEPEWPDRIDTLDRDATYLIYCRSGSRSSRAGAYMEQIGFSSVVNLEPGILGWPGELVR